MLDQEHGDPFGVAVDQHTLVLASLRWPPARSPRPDL
jgi:hypothetical protein